MLELEAAGDAAQNRRARLVGYVRLDSHGAGADAHGTKASGLGPAGRQRTGSVFAGQQVDTHLYQSKRQIIGVYNNVFVFCAVVQF